MRRPEKDVYMHEKRPHGYSQCIPAIITFFLYYKRDERKEPRERGGGWKRKEKEKADRAL